MKTLFSNLSKTFSLLVLCLALFPLSISNVYAVDIQEASLFISQKCPTISSGAIKESLVAYNNAKAMGISDKSILTIVDYSKPSSENRICSIDLKDRDIVYNGLVAHGLNSGDQYATHFSNKVGSNQSSLGLYLTGKPYYGKAGYSLTLYGLDRGINDQAAARHVVVHGSPRVNMNVAKKRGKVGHTLGCFGLNDKVSDQVIDKIKGGSLLFAYYPSQQLHQKSIFLIGVDA